MKRQVMNYETKVLIWAILGVVFACTSLKLVGGIGTLSIGLIALGALSKNRMEWLLYSILMITCLTVTNNNFAPKGFIFTIISRVIYLLLAIIMTLQLTSQRTSKILAPFLCLFIYILYMSLISYYGWNPMISYLKLLLFIFVFLAFFSVTNAIAVRTNTNSCRLRSVILALMFFFIIGSICLIPFPALSKMGASYYVSRGLEVPEGELFIGMTDHAQSLGTMMAMMGVLLIADLLFSIRRLDRLYLMLIGGACFLVFKSASRTAMGTLVGGSLIAILLFLRAYGISPNWRNRVWSWLVIMLGISFLLLIGVPSFRQGIISFVYKYHGDDVAEEYQTYESFMSSRQRLIDNAMDNFTKSPWIGNGFQVSLRYKGWAPSSWKQLLSAPVEKGIWIPAVLEEGGIFGMLLFLIFLFVASIKLLTYRAYIGLVSFLSFIISNLGEFTIFSMSSSGGFFWAMVFAGIALDAQRLKEEQRGARWQ